MLVWIFMMRVLMIVSSGGSYLINAAITKARYGHADKMNFEQPLTNLVWLTSCISIVLTFIISALLVGGDKLGDPSLWWKLSIVISCGTLAGALIPELVKIFTSTNSTHVKEVVTSSREGGPRLTSVRLRGRQLLRLLARLRHPVLMSVAYFVSTTFPTDLMLAPAVFSFGLVAFGFLGMGPVTIAVDSYGPVTDNAQSVFELSTIETLPNIKEEVKGEFGFEPDFETGKQNLEENDGAGNTFKATAKPVLIGTAVVGATTMIFSIILALTEGLKPELVANLSILHPPFLLGIIMGGAMIYWFTGASTQAVVAGAYRAVEFIKRNIRLDSESTKASVEDSTRVVAICTQYAQRGMINIFLAVFFGTLAFAFFEPFFFVGYLISIAMFGLFQAIFMADAGAAWDNAKKIVETDLKEKGTELHAATVVGDTVGDPFKDTSSVAMNPVIKFTTLFGLLAVELAVSIASQAGGADYQVGDGSVLTYVLSGVFFLISAFFVWRSFYKMRIHTSESKA
jgi:K(+)-stimulated pyrophosphate-energized sodium pump